MGEYGDPRIPANRPSLDRRLFRLPEPPAGHANYPVPYITTNTRDDRVHPGHARKFAARMQSLGYTALYYEDTDGGHSNDSAIPLLNAERWARHYVYLAQQLGLKK
jgi:prolyl oligopeptidase